MRRILSFSGSNREFEAYLRAMEQIILVNKNKKKVYKKYE
ncbi:MAG: hypothetical protein PWQ37_2580 [Candidatus Petromonas sp.]|jgi:hypothetical protein|nr:hypothetical protein [Candidatus Petromonas sp.]